MRSGPDEPDFIDPDVILRIDAICEEFEAAILANGSARPSLESYLDGFEGGARSRLFHYLLELEVEYRQRHGEAPTRDEYFTRFPDLSGAIQGHRIFAGASALGDTRLGGYQILREIGAGGMGVVYEAYHEALDRRVALKVLPEYAQASTTMTDRFLREARAAGQLNHPNIVPVFEVARIDGTLFFAMQLVDGPTLDQVRRGIPASGPPAAAGRAETTGSGLQHAVDAALPHLYSSDIARYHRNVARIGIQAAAALEHAHSRSILHRDVKPSNLLLDCKGTVWVADFGIAKLGDSDLTSPGDILGTVRYMAPERFQGACDARADIFGLGLTLWELLTLQPAFAATDRTSLVDEIVRKGPDRPRSIDRRIPKALETVVMKAVAHDVDARYGSAAAMAEDLRRFVEGRPILARRASPVARLGLWARRNPGIAAALAGVFLLMLAATVVSTIASRRFEKQSADNAALAVRALDQQRVAEGATRAAQENLYFAEMNLASNAASIASGTGTARAVVDGWSAPGDRAQDPRGFEWCLLHALTHRELRAFSAAVRGLAFMPDQPVLVSYTDGLTLQDAETGELVQRIPIDIQPFSLCVSPTGDRIAAAGLGGIRIVDVDTGGMRKVDGETAAVSFSSDGKYVAAQLFSGTILVIAAADAALITSIKVRSEGLPVFSPNGKYLVSNGPVDQIMVVDTLNWQTIREIPSPVQVLALAVSSDSRLIAATRADGQVTVAEMETGEIVQVLSGHDGRRSDGASFLPDGRLVSIGCDGVARIWDPRTGRQLDALRGHAGMIVGLATSADGRFVATFSRSDGGRIWNAAIRPPEHVLDATRLPHPYGERGSVFFSDDGARLAASANVNGAVWELPDFTPITGAEGDTYSESADGWLRARRVEGTLVIDERVSGREVARISASTRHFHLVWHPSEPRLLFSTDGMLHAWDFTRGSTVVPGWDGGGRGLVNRIAWNPDGRHAAICADQTMMLIDAQSGAIVGRGQPTTPNPYGLAFSKDGARVAVSGHLNRVRVLDAESLEEQLVLTGHAHRVWAVSWHPDGSRIATGAADGTVRIWEAVGGRLATTLTVGSDIRAVEFSPDGKRLAAVDADGIVHVWNATAGYDQAQREGAGTQGR